jgi:hypothetical protein
VFSPPVRTTDAAAALGLSPSTLRRYIDAGIFVEGQHFHRGVYKQTPWRWDVAACRAKLATPNPAKGGVCGVAYLR